MWKEASMQVVEKGSEAGLGRGTEKVCGPTHPRVTRSKKDLAPWGGPQPAVKQVDSTSEGAALGGTARGDRTRDPGTHSLLSPLCPVW